MVPQVTFATYNQCNEYELSTSFRSWLPNTTYTF